MAGQQTQQTEVNQRIECMDGALMHPLTIAAFDDYGNRSLPVEGESWSITLRLVVEWVGRLVVYWL